MINHRYYYLWGENNQSSELQTPPPETISTIAEHGNIDYINCDVRSFVSFHVRWFEMMRGKIRFPHQIKMQATAPKVVDPIPCHRQISSFVYIKHDLGSTNFGVVEIWWQRRKPRTANPPRHHCVDIGLRHLREPNQHVRELPQRLNFSMLMLLFWSNAFEYPVHCIHVISGQLQPLLH